MFSSWNLLWLPYINNKGLASPNMILENIRKHPFNSLSFGFRALPLTHPAPMKASSKAPLSCALAQSIYILLILVHITLSFYLPVSSTGQ